MRLDRFGDSTPLRPDLVENFSRTWVNLANPGASWTGAERVGIAAEARRARRDEPPQSTLPTAAVEAARRLAAEPAAVRRGWVEAIIAQLDYEQYVELVGVVARLVATDTFFEALGMSLESLPEPVAGNSTGEVASRARLGRGWVPMVGGTSITQALSLVPAENAELKRFHSAMYLTFEQMSDSSFVRGLTRAQMELVASRTSAINECFY